MTAPRRTSVRVSILGDDFTLRTQASEEDTRAVAKQVDTAIREIMQAGVIESHKAAILACLRMAGELMQAREDARALSTAMSALSQEIRPWLPPAKRYD